MSYQNEKILVAICNFNHGHFLKQSIESIQEQSYKNLDICVVDDGSYDQETIELLVSDLQSQDNRIRLLKNKSNLGKWHCLNSAIATTNAAICTSHDADDVSLPFRLERQLKTMKHHNSFHNLTGFFHCFSESDVVYNQSLYGLNDYKQSSSLLTVEHDVVLNAVGTGLNTHGINHYFTGDFETAGVTAMFNTNLWKSGIRFNPPNSGLRILSSEDSDFNARMTILFGRTSILAEQHYCYRRNTSTNTEEI